MTLDELRERGERMSEALSREAYEAGAGLKAQTQFERIFEEYRDCASDEAWEAARGNRPLEEWAADNRIGRAVASLDDRLQAWESAARITLEDGSQMPFQQAGIAIGNEPNRDRRRMIDRARRAVLADPAAIRAERLGREEELLRGMTGMGVVAARTRLSGMDLGHVAEQCGRFLHDTADQYRDTLAEYLKAEIGITLGEADRTDGSYLFRGASFDEFFPGPTLADTARRQVGEMGLHAEAGGRITYDTGEREGKRPRAFCAPVRVPDEVYLVIRPHGGYTDYRAFWHELGHALHFANASRALPFESRWLGDNSVTECYAMLFEHQTMARPWLERYAGLRGERLQAFLRAQAFALLAIVRRYAAKLIYEISLQSGPSLAHTGNLYVETLTAATGFRYAPEDALMDLDDGFYSARYLRAWQLEAALRARLIEEFDEDWFRNPRSGAFVLALLERGQQDDAVEVARTALGAKLTFAPLQRQCESMLG